MTTPAWVEGKRVLVAEDSSVNQLVIKAMLKRIGVAHVLVETGRQALAALGEGGYDLVLMDLQMPEFDGLDAARAWRVTEGASGAHVPIIALSASALAEDAERCRAAGMDDFISKPVDRAALLEVLERWLGSKPCPVV